MQHRHYYISQPCFRTWSGGPIRESGGLVGRSNHSSGPGPVVPWAGPITQQWTMDIRSIGPPDQVSVALKVRA